MPIESWDASATKDKSVLVYVEDDGLGNNTYKLTISGNGHGKIFANANSGLAFADFTNVTEITGFNDGENVIFDTKSATLM